MEETGDVHHPKRSVAGTEPSAADRARSLAPRWNEAVDRAFATALERPDAYQRTARVVGALTTALREHGRGVSALLEAWTQRDGIVEGVAAADERHSLEGLDADAVVGAAFAMRYREALEEAAVDARMDALARSAAQRGWTVAEEEGYSAGDPFIPYRRVEVDAASGRALVVMTEPDEGFTTCHHRVTELRIDVSTGQLGEAPSPTEVLSSAEDRERLVERLKAAASGPSEGIP